MGEGLRVKDQRGATFVEFALSAWLLSILLFAIIQYGFLFAAFITIRNASAVGARQATIATNNVPAFAKQALGPMLDPNRAGTTVTLTSTNVSGLAAWRVTVSYPVPLIPIPLNKIIVPGATNNTCTLTATTVMR